MKPVRLILIPATGSQPAPFLIVGADGQVLERGALGLDGGPAPEPMRTVAVAPGGDVLIRWLDLPPGSTTQGRAAAAWMLRDQLAAAPERLVIVLGPPAPAHEPRLVSVVSRSLLEAWSDYLAALGVRADVLIPDVLTLAEPEPEAGLSAVAFGEGMALRGHHFAATVQPDLVEVIADGRRIVPVQDSAAVERALVAAALAPALNLLDTGEREAKAAVGWRRAAILAALVVLSPLVLILAAAARDSHAAGAARSEALAAITAAAPELAREADPVEALRRRVNAAPPPGGVTAAAAALFSAVESVEGAELDILIADPDDGVKATISHPDLGDMAMIGRSMAAAGMSVTETGTLEDGGRVVSDITIGAPR